MWRVCSCFLLSIYWEKKQTDSTYSSISRKSSMTTLFVVRSREKLCDTINSLPVYNRAGRRQQFFSCLYSTTRAATCTDQCNGNGWYRMHHQINKRHHNKMGTDADTMFSLIDHDVCVGGVFLTLTHLEPQWVPFRGENYLILECICPQDASAGSKIKPFLSTIYPFTSSTPRVRADSWW